jgi:flagellar biosynthesis/type III secretory pathway protein FliH
LLQQQRRIAQYRFQQRYLEGLRQQRLRIQNERNYNYSRDPYFYTAPSYRYSRGGSYYETNQYGANLLRQAINNGYEEGFRAGQADREDRWASNYQDSYAYQDANYGYGGLYLDQDDYNYYFREGFRRGYEDGYGRRSQYGRYSGGKYSILGNILSQILNLEPLQ